MEPANGEWRLRSLEGRVSSIERSNPAVLEEKTRNLDRAVSELGDEVKSLRRALYSFALSIVAGSLIFAFSVLQLLAR